MVCREEVEKNANHSNDSRGSGSSLCIASLEFHEIVDVLRSDILFV